MKFKNVAKHRLEVMYLIEQGAKEMELEDFVYNKFSVPSKHITSDWFIAFRRQATIAVKLLDLYQYNYKEYLRLKTYFEEEKE